jgi:hypothetical protein
LGRGARDSVAAEINDCHRGSIEIHNLEEAMRRRMHDPGVCCD